MTATTADGATAPLPPAAPAEASTADPATDLSKRVFGLDLMRAIAILMVMISHSRVLFERHVEGADEIFMLGFISIELFFVLSGFLIGGILINQIGPESNGGDMRNFWVRRWFRTLPAYYFWLAIEIAVYAATKGAAVFSAFALHPFFLQTLVWSKPPIPFNVTWSLVVEEWFYLITPIVLYVTCKLTKSRQTGFLVACAFMIVAPALLRAYYAIGLDAPWGPHIRDTAVVRLDAIAYGLLGAVLFRYYRPLWDKYRVPAFLIGFSIMMATAIYVQMIDRQHSVYAKTLNFSLISFGILLMVPVIRSLPRPSSKLFASFILYSSLWSYSAYLTHMLVLRLLLTIDKKADAMGHGTIAVSFILWLSFLPIVAVISRTSYTFIEVRGLALREKFSRKEKHQA